MVNREQVSLIITNENTADFVKSLKVNKMLKSTIVRFLDKYAENPEQVSVWLESDDSSQNGAVEENEKLSNLKSSLALFTTFVQTAKLQNDRNVEDFTDYLTNEEYIKFRTEFEKSEQLVAAGNLDYIEETNESEPKNKNLEKVVESLSQQVQELKTILTEALTGDGNGVSLLKNKVTTPTNEYSYVEEEQEKEIEQIKKEPSISDKEQPSSENKATVVKNSETKTEPIQDNSVNDEEDMDFSDALSIMEGLGM